MSTPGLIVLMGSGETAPSGRILHESAFQKLPIPVNVSIMETPAGFELNSSQVANRVSNFLEHRLQNYNPSITVIPARRNESEFGTNNPDILGPLLFADYIFMGPGSPSYAVRHLTGSLAWNMVLARHRLGACLAFSSSAAIAIGEIAVPIYEIYKVGEDPHWIPGLNLLSEFGLRIACVTHWNNTEGGVHLDTSRCFMGKSRMTKLLSMLPIGVTLIGIDEHTALMLDFSQSSCQVVGKGTVTLINGKKHQVFETGTSFALSKLGTPRIPHTSDGIPTDVWADAVAANQACDLHLPVEIEALISQREQARNDKDWNKADSLRHQILDLGYTVLDTPDGPKWDAS